MATAAGKRDRVWEEGGTGSKRSKGEGSSDEGEGGKRQPKKKVAMLMAFCGQGYAGMQINPGVPTIEEELRVAFSAAGLVADFNSANLNKVKFQRTARTDKNVSAAGQVVSFKAIMVPDLVEAVNKHLPEKIRILGYRRVTGGFNCKMACSSRQYDYLLPTFSFAPTQELTNESYRLDEAQLSKVRDTLSKFEGTHNFHNYTSGKKPNDASAMRYIHWFKAEEPFMQDGLEMMKLSVKGQSFMLHQIRKMVGLTIGIVRGNATIDKVAESFKEERMDVPKAPGLGLVLEKVFFEGYNKKAPKEYGTIEWPECEEAREAFKAKYIYAEIIGQEKTTQSMLQWLPTLQHHTFDGSQMRDFIGKTPSDDEVGEDD